MTRRTMYRVRMVLGVCAAVVAAACAPRDASRDSGNAGASANAKRAPAIGAPAPVLALHDLNDAPQTLESLKGRVVVLNVWATWCQPCREELPQLEALFQQFKAQNVAMIGVSVDAEGMGSDVRDFAKEHGMSYPIWLDPDHDFALKFLTIGVPETFVVDAAGVIRWRKIGALTKGDTTLAGAVRAAMTPLAP